MHGQRFPYKIHRLVSIHTRPSDPGRSRRAWPHLLFIAGHLLPALGRFRLEPKAVRLGFYRPAARAYARDVPSRGAPHTFPLARHETRRVDGEDTYDHAHILFCFFFLRVQTYRVFCDNTALAFSRALSSSNVTSR